MTTQTTTENFEGFFLTDYKGTIRQVLGCVYTPKSNNFKNMKTPNLKKKLHVVDYADTRLIEYLTETKKFAKPFLPLHKRLR